MIAEGRMKDGENKNRRKLWQCMPFMSAFMRLNYPFPPFPGCKALCSHTHTHPAIDLLASLLVLLAMSWSGPKMIQFGTFCLEGFEELSSM